MIVSSPIWHSCCHLHRCQWGHKPRKAWVVTRGSCLLFHECDRCKPSSYAMGIQNGSLDLVTWYAISREQYTLLLSTEESTPVLTMLVLAGYHDGADAEAAA